MEIKWTGPEKYIPEYGIFKKGDLRTLPGELARELIDQGLASTTKKTVYEEKGKPPSRVTKKKEKEE
jgi:hypothetical protein